MKELTASSIIVNNPVDNWFGQLSSMKKPIIAAVNGYAIGGGCEVAMMCDIIIASKTAKFALPESKIGLIPGVGGTERLVRTVGKFKAMELVLTGDAFSAVDAKRIGLVNKVVDNALDEAIGIGRKIINSPLHAICSAKMAINFSLEVGLSEGLEHELSLFNSSVSL